MKNLLAQKVKEQQAILDAAKSENGRSLTNEESTKFSALQTEIDTLRAKIDDEERQKGQNDAIQRALELERERISAIGQIVKDAGARGLDLDAQDFIKRGLTVDEVNKIVLERFMKGGEPMQASNEHAQITVDENDKLRNAASDAILMRSGRTPEKVSDGAREMRGMSLRDIAIECLQRSGVANAQRLDSNELFKRALTPDSNFASILSDSVNKSMANAYKAASTTYQTWTSKGSNPDFKGATHYQISEAGELTKMSQTSEFTFDEMTDRGVTKSIATFGKEFGITRQALINDDLSVLTRIPEAYVRAASRGINTLVYKTLTGNPTIFDGKALFHNAHGNMAGTGGAITIPTLSDGRKAMRKQTNLRGKEVLNISPQYLLVGPDKETEAEQLISSIVDPTKNNATPNPFSNKLQIVCDANIQGNEWYLVANPLDCEGIEVTYLNGNSTPMLESQVGFDYLGMKWRIYIDYGVNVLDFRGLYKNAGN